jgi:hypothetical protein
VRARDSVASTARETGGELGGNLEVHRSGGEGRLKTTNRSATNIPKSNHSGDSRLLGVAMNREPEKLTRVGATGMRFVEVYAEVAGGW